MILVTHDIDEALYMSDRVAILSPRPGRVDRLIDVPFERPRQRTAPPFLRLRADILEFLHLAGKSSYLVDSGRS
jgi:NitT/TauT family transport system ATP-binding protein/sulfonate transport system ATP-binding protein